MGSAYELLTLLRHSHKSVSQFHLSPKNEIVEMLPPSVHSGRERIEKPVAIPFQGTDTDGK
jgi:hypothetical protein